MRVFWIRGLPALALVLAAPSLAQMPGPLRADIPFAFHVGDDQMPPGKYNIRDVYSGNRAILFSLVDRTALPAVDRHNALRFGIPLTTAKSADGKVFVVFNKYGNDRYFVSQIRVSDGSAISFAKSRRERELIVSKVIARHAVETVTITARVVD